MSLNIEYHLHPEPQTPDFLPPPQIFWIRFRGPEAIQEYFFNNLVDLFKKYMICGGMPAVVRIVNQSHNFSEVEQVL